MIRRATYSSRQVSTIFTWGSVAVALAAVIALGALNWRASVAYDRALKAETEGIRVLQHARYLDDQTTLTTLLAVATSRAEWRARYDSLDVAMQGTIKQVERGPGASAPNAVERLRRADSAMTALERIALYEAESSRARADAILNGEEYASTKRRFDEALRDASTSIQARLNEQRDAAHRRAVNSMVVALCAVLVLLIAGSGVIVVLRQHVSALAHLADQLRMAKELAEAADRSKGEFLAGMSHELRTPLTAVIGFANILKKNKSGRLGAVELEYVTRIQRSGRHLLTLINEVLDLARLESRRVAMDYEPVELRSLVQDAVDLAVVRSESQGNEVRLELPPDGQWVETDRSRLTQVLINLVGNAMKFTHGGTVTVKLTGEAETGDVVRLAVSDTGIGIPSDRLDAIFQPFEQADNTTARRFGGTGLGLAISRTIVSALGGELRAHSTAGAGSTFTVEIPRRRRALSNESGAGPGEADVEKRGGRRLVLVIDDDADARRIIAHQVEEAGADVLLASSGEDGLRLAAERRPHAITLDLVMPGLSGLEVLRRLKDDQGLATIPVVIVSVVPADAGSLFGAVDVVQKPLEPGALANALQRQLGPLRRGGADVLVVEGEGETRNDLLEKLRTAGASTVRTAADGRSALMLLEERTPDLMVLNLLHPEMSGISFLRALRLDVRWAHLPVILVTAEAPNEREAALFETELVAVLREGDDIGDRITRALRAVLPPAGSTLSESA